MPRSPSRALCLRLALALVMERRGLTHETLAQDIGIEFATLKNFLDGRNKLKNISEIEEYLRNLKIELDPALIFILQELFPKFYKSPNTNINFIYPVAIKSFLKIDESHSIPNFNEYAGSYLGYRHAFDEEQVTVIWIQIFGPSNDIDMPTYKAFQRSASGAEFWGNGFVVSSRLNIALVGSKSAANIELARLTRIDPPISFLHGIVLTENRHGIPLAAKIYCDRISADPNFDREQYDNIITNMDLKSFRKALGGIGKSEDDIAKIIFHIDNQVPHYKSPNKNILISSIDPSLKDYERYKKD